LAEQLQPTRDSPAPPWFLKRLILGGGIAVLVLVVASFAFLQGGSSNGVSGPDALDFAEVVTADLVQQVSFNGTLGSIQNDPVRTRFGGTITAIASPGDTIGQGGTLFELDGEPVVLLFGDAPTFRDMAIGEDAITISSQLTGTITEVVEAGSVIQQGDVVYAVDGEPVIALYGVHPAFRDLTMGEDVVTVSSQAGGVITEIAAPGAIIEQGDMLFRVNDRGVIAFYGELPAFRSLSDNRDAIAAAAKVIAFAERDLAAENASLSIALASSGATDEQSAVASAELAYRETLVRWLGAVPEGFVLLPLDQILSAWGTTLTRIYAPPVPAIGDPATPWNEAVVWAWATLWPVPIDVEATSSPDPDNPLALAPRGEMTDAWTSLITARVAYDAQLASDAAAVLTAEKAVVAAEETLVAAKSAQSAVVANTGDDVRQLQTALVSLGYDAGGTLVVDGAFMAETTDALLAFQAVNGLLQDGVMDLGEIVFLPGVAQVTERLASPGDSSGGAILQLSTGEPRSGADVLQLELALIALGYDAGGRLVADGVSSAETTLAVLALQAASGLEQDGVLDHGEVVFIPGPSQALNVLKVPGQTASGGIVIASTGEFASGADVLQLEEALVGLGFDAGGTLVADGVYSVETVAAVRAFQGASGLAQDGIINLGEVVFLPTGLRVINQFVTEGGGVSQGSPVLGVSLSAKVVRVDLPASDQGVFSAGDPVIVEMPDFTEVPATVLSVAETATGTQSAPATFDVVIALDDSAAAAGLDEAPVEVVVVSDAVVGATAVPVSALVALLKGGYAVEVDDGEGGTRLVGVEVGFFGESGLIQITEGALAPGDRVVVP